MLLNYYADRDKEKTGALFDHPDLLSPDDFDKDSYFYLYTMTNLFHSTWTNSKDVINTVDFWWGDTRGELRAFSDFFKLFSAPKNENAMTWQQRALFYGFSLYLSINGTLLDKEKQSDWLSFIRNMITNGTIDSYTPFVSAKKRMDEFAKNSGDIYTYLAAVTETSGFASDQLKEEIRKAKIYANTPDAKPVIQEIENCDFCRGHTGFVLECLDIEDFVSDIDRLKKMKDILFEH